MAPAGRGVDTRGRGVDQWSVPQQRPLCSVRESGRGKSCVSLSQSLLPDAEGSWGPSDRVSCNLTGNPGHVVSAVLPAMGTRPGFSSRVPASCRKLAVFRVPAALSRLCGTWRLFVLLREIIVFSWTGDLKKYAQF